MLTCVLFACQVEEVDSSKEKKVIDELSNSFRYYEFTLLPNVEKFIELNHQGSTCSDDMLKGIYELYLFLNLFQRDLIEKSGGYDENGNLISALNFSFARDMMVKFDLFNEIDTRISNLKQYTEQDETGMAKLVFEKLQKDLKMLNVPVYREGKGDLSVIQLLNDVLLLKSSLLYSEIMYYELLKSTGC